MPDVKFELPTLPPRAKVWVERNSKGYTYGVQVELEDPFEAYEKAVAVENHLKAQFGRENHE